MWLYPVDIIEFTYKKTKKSGETELWYRYYIF